jgi:hypothetical protein
MKLKITSFENRGSMEVPYGWLYFNDGTRMGYHPGGRQADADGLYEGDWGGCTELHQRLAREYVRLSTPKRTVVHG